MSERGSTRDSIFSLIEDNPGIHFREIQRRSGLAVGQVEYHLYQLEKEERIVSREDGKVKRYFCISKESLSERQLLFYLRSNNSREVLQKLARNESLPLAALLKVRKAKLDKRKSMLNDMERDRIIEIFQEGKTDIVRIRDLPKLLDIARRYRESFLETLSDNFLSLLDEDTD